MASRIQLVLYINQGNLGGRRELAGTFAAYICDEETTMEQNYTYLLLCADGSLYCGWTNHLEARVEAHNSGKGAKYTKSRRPVQLVYYEVFATKQEAMRREWALKQLTRKEKLDLIEAWKKEQLG